MTNLWTSKHKEYSKQNWIDKPSIFAQEVIGQFPNGGKLLELGAGQGQDSRYFASKGFFVTSTDNDLEALRINGEKSKNTQNYEVTELDIVKTFPFQNEDLDIVYAHLSLHYFDIVTSKKIFEEIHRVLKPGGKLAVLVNSFNDPEYGKGKEIDDDYFLIDSNKKRYFSTNTLSRLVDGFDTVMFDDKGETYKDQAKGIHNLIRYVGRKK